MTEQELRAENARLRAALEGMHVAFDAIHPNHPITDGCSPCMRDVHARTVLDSSDALDDLRVIREAMDAIDCGCTDDNCWRREAYAALKERFGDNK
jgi:hypothetical protein